MIKIAALCILLTAVLACPDEPNCRQCVKEADTFKCADCYLGWADKNGKCMIKKASERLEHCNNYQEPKQGEENKCAICEWGFVQQGGKCVACKVEGCAICDSNIDECKACLEGHKLKEKKCVKEDNEVPNCLICQYGVSKDFPCTCRQCKDKYVINGKLTDKDQCVTDSIGNCHILDINDVNRCGKCLPNFYIGTDGKCYSNDRKSYSVVFWILLGLVLLSIPLIWFCIKKRRERHSHDHYHTVPVPVNANTNLPYTQRLVN